MAFKNNDKPTAIPVPDKTPEGNYQSIMALKEAVEMITGQRGRLRGHMPTWQQLIDLGIVTEDQVPTLGQ